MGSIGGMLGTAGGASGSGFKAPGQTPILDGTNAGNLSQTNTQVQNALGSQQALLQALQAQQGLNAQGSAMRQQSYLSNDLAGTQSVGAQQQALKAQQGLNNQFSGAGGVQNQSAALASQQALAQQQQATAGQYQNIANGVGPNPAQAMLNQQTGTNVANQAALMAGQRGAGSNVGLLARQAAQQGAATQQESVGQGATLQAQQSLNALSGLSAQQQAIGNTQQNVAGIAGQQVGQQQQGIGAAQAAASGITEQRQAQQQALAGTANTVAGQQIAGTTANSQGAQSAQQIQQQAAAAQNNARVGSQSSVNSGNTTLANTNMQGQQAIVGGLMNSMGSGMGMMLARGGEVPTHFDAGGAVGGAGAQSSYGQFLNGWGGGGGAPPPTPQSDGPFNMASPSNPGAAALQKGFSSFGAPLKKVTGMLGGSGGGGGEEEGIMSLIPMIAAMAAKGGEASRDMTGGGGVNSKTPNQKATKKGDSYSNDKIPAMLSEHEIVIPRSVTQGKDPVRGAAEFVAKVLAKKRRK